MGILRLTAVIRKENPVYSSWCPELDIASQGETRELAYSNLKEAIELCLETPEVREMVIERAEKYQDAGIGDGTEILCLDIDPAS